MGVATIAPTSSTAWLLTDMVGTAHWLRLSDAPWCREDGAQTTDVSADVYPIQRVSSDDGTAVQSAVPALTRCVPRVQLLVR